MTERSTTEIEQFRARLVAAADEPGSPAEHDQVDTALVVVDWVLGWDENRDRQA